MSKADWGIVGMGVMGTALSRNFARQGYQLALYNRFLKGQEEQLAHNRVVQFEELKNAFPFEALAPFVNALSRPRKIMLMIAAGGLDSFLEVLLPHLEADDIVIDGGNSHYLASIKRTALCAEKGIHLVSLGVSGGEEGALLGPSLMGSGSSKALAKIEADLAKIAAQNSKGQACFVSTVGPGSGHFIKMVHNGIEYAEMQLLAECYDFMRSALGLSASAIGSVFEVWEKTSSKSYLLQISASILRENNTAGAIVDQILDQASNKGTGKWATQAAIDLGLAVPLISAALEARYISSFKGDRESFSRIYNVNKLVYEDQNEVIEQLKAVYDFCRLINHHQGFELLRIAAQSYSWELSLSDVARAWTAGCIINSTLMEELTDAFQTADQILSQPQYAVRFQNQRENLEKAFNRVLTALVPMPCSAAAWHYFLGLIQKESSANLIQAQRDYFGAHGLHWKDQPEGELDHGPWKQKQ